MGTDLSTGQLSVRGEVKDVLDELGDSVPSDPEEHVLAVLDDVEPVALEALAGQIHRFGEDHSVLANRAGLVRKGEVGQHDHRGV